MPPNKRVPGQPFQKGLWSTRAFPEAAPPPEPQQSQNSGENSSSNVNNDENHLQPIKPPTIPASKGSGDNVRQ
jgi:hypothetical protein